MRMMTCKQLGGACDQAFKADTFDEIAQMSKKHGIEMFQNADEKHIKAMNEMKKLMSEAGAMEKWMEDRKRELDALPECEWNYPGSWDTIREF